MKILVVGSGGREHAIVWKLKQSPKNPILYCAPGNAGIASIAECVPIKAKDLKGMTEFALKEGIDLVFVAPDDPLALGMVNAMREAGIRAFGPTREAAIIEASKSFSKDLMKRYNIPTAGYEIFKDKNEALKYIDSQDLPIVIKADGLALGKGVIIAQSRDEAKSAVHEMMDEGVFGQAGETLVIEEFLKGKELTVLAFTDGKTVVPMMNSRDHKKAFDNDKGPNTGGMGAICPGEKFTDEETAVLFEKIFIPTINAMEAEGRNFSGVIYFGLMLTEEGPKVIEYNARFGDPETQAVLPLLETDLIDIIESILNVELDKITVKWKDAASCCVVMASGGYPVKYTTGYPISGLGDTDCYVFHAGTAFTDDKRQIVTSGGRVLGVTAVSGILTDAIDKAYENVSKIKFENMHFRHDIGKTT
ncbi:MAG: phosphoribosylamine--glycine ligase [Saccharofermentanales bacterium]